MRVDPARREHRTSTAVTEEIDVTILLPCRNEERTVAICVTDALTWIAGRGLVGEVLVVDNASTDRSATAARIAGARVISEPRVGYGRALRSGAVNARGRVVIFADADNTYGLGDLDAFYDPIATERSCDVVIGNRLGTARVHGAMSLMHLWGNRGLSALTRAAIGTSVTDVHCGLRSTTPSAMLAVSPHSTGMEYATEMIIQAHRTGLRIGEHPVVLGPVATGRRSHLRPFRDGVRHLRRITRHAIWR
ncbi:glycosyltransferase family 2 protein [Sanguibacter sp. 25GB23B1]|uniref:glycosyltransferase family 2 protein n=1 Tax=unclassified Sanguibacter TaxID=2645534 RepID=UPI0032B02407